MKARAIKATGVLIEMFALAAVFFIPLYFSFFYQSYSQFALEKVSLFRIIAEIIFILILLKIILEKRIAIFASRKHLWFVLIFFAALALGAAFSIDPGESFRGSYMRQQGLFTHLHYLLFFFAIIYYAKDKKRAERLISAILFGSLLVSLYGIAQWLGLEFIPWQKSLVSAHRIVSTMGQPVFLGNYLVLVIFLSAFKLLSLIRRGRGEAEGEVGILKFRDNNIVNHSAPPIIKEKGFLSLRLDKNFLLSIFYSLIFFSNLFCLIFTYTRGAWLGFVCGAFFVFFFVLYFKNIKLKLSYLSAAFFILLLLSGAFYVLFPNNFFISRIKSMADFKSGSLAMRAETFKAAIIAASESPITGYGPENGHQVFIKYYNPLWSVYEDINTAADRAHNFVLDLMLEGGMILLFGYAAFFIFLVIYGLKKAKEGYGRGDYLALFLLTSVLAYHTSLLASFPTVETAVVFWSLAGLLYVLFNNRRQEVLIDFNNFRKIYFYLFLYFCLLAFVFALYIIKFNIDNQRADYYFKKARASFYNRNYYEMFNSYAKTLSLNSEEAYYRWFYINDITESLKQVNSQDYAKTALDYIKKNYPQDESESFQDIFLRAKIYSALGKYEDKNFFIKAEEEYKKLTEVSPLFPDIYKSWGDACFYAEDYKKAIAVYNMALNVLPGQEFSLKYPEHAEKINKFKADVYAALAAAYLQAEDFSAAIENYKKIIKIFPFRLDAYKNAADAYYKKGDWDAAIWYNKRGYMLNPDDYLWPLAIGLIYKEKGDFQNALIYAEEAQNILPDNETIKNLIEELKQNG